MAEAPEANPTVSQPFGTVRMLQNAPVGPSRRAAYHTRQRAQSAATEDGENPLIPAHTFTWRPSTALFIVRLMKTCIR